MGTLTTSKNIFMFGAVKPDPAIGYASANIGSLGVRLEIVTQDVSGLKGRVH